MGKKPKGKQALMLGDWDDEGGEGDLTANPIVEKTAEIATSPAPIQKQIEEEETEAQDEEEQESQTAATTTTLSKKEKEKLKKKRQAEKKKLEKAQAASSTGGDDGGAKGDGGKKEETKLEKIAKGGGVRAAALNALKVRSLQWRGGWVRGNGEGKGERVCRNVYMIARRYSHRHDQKQYG